MITGRGLVVWLFVGVWLLDVCWLLTTGRIPDILLVVVGCWLVAVCWCSVGNGLTVGQLLCVVEWCVCLLVIGGL